MRLLYPLANIDDVNAIAKRIFNEPGLRTASDWHVAGVVVYGIRSDRFAFRRMTSRSHSVTSHLVA